MLKKYWQKYVPNYKTIKSNKQLKIFGSLLHANYLWSKNTNNIANACSIGIFVAMLPTLGHMLLATVLCIVFKANLPIAVTMVWISNPLTMPFLYTQAYFFGLKLLSLPMHQVNFTGEHFFHNLPNIWRPLLLGCVIEGLCFAFIINLIVRFWYKKDK